jgi:hypothetical protein
LPAAAFLSQVKAGHPLACSVFPSRTYLGTILSELPEIQ